MSSPKHIHFLGIGGSGMSAVAQIAAAQGYEVSGCDLQTDTPYLAKVRAAGIPVFSGHDREHLENADLLAVTPAVLYQNNHHPEVEAARSRDILLTWQDFLGKYLHRDKFVICVAGTHGKSTTAAWAGCLLEQAGLDPTVEVGATVTAWHNNVRLPIGQSRYFVSEADEFHDNFKNYWPDVVILNNLEMDHPEYFKNMDNLLRSYLSFISNIKPGGTLIYNSNSTGVLNLIELVKSHHSSLNLIPYNYFDVSDIQLASTGTFFIYKKVSYQIALPGHHNIENALGIIELARLLNISFSDLDTTLRKFSGTGRRLELIGTKNGIQVFDDYANHPTAFMATLQATKQLTGNSPIWAVIEPHTFSRLRAVLSQLPESLANADHVIVSKVYASREQDPGDFTGADIVSAAKHPDARYIPEFPDIVEYLHSQLQTHNSRPVTILVMGSGLSFQLARDILTSL